MISQFVFGARIDATFILLVTTIKSLWCSNSRATASVEVPMLRNTQAPAGMSLAQARAIARLAGWFSNRRSSYPKLVIPEGRTAPPCTRSSRPSSANSLRSRRIVCTVTPKCAARSSTATFPVSRAISSISGRRSVCDIRDSHEHGCDAKLSQPNDQPQPLGGISRGAPTTHPSGSDNIYFLKIQA